MASTMDKTDKRYLPKKELDLYKSIAKHYETKQYKKGVKAADTVLKKYPEHGETQAMKGLCLSLMDGKEEEALALVKLGLRNDMRSHVCWHVMGLLHRGQKEYLQAIKAYKQALRIDPSNMLILRDNSLLQVQMRDYNGFVETRRKILMDKSNNKGHWMAFAVANHIRGDLATAEDILTKYAATVPEGSRRKDYEESELVLYKHALLVGQGKIQEGLAWLDESKDWVVDKLGWGTARAEALLLLERHEEAREAWRSLLLDYSTENYVVHRGWQCALLELPPSSSSSVLALKALDLAVHAVPLTAAQQQVLMDAYAALARDRPRSRAVRRIPVALLAAAASTSSSEAESTAAAVTALTQPLTDYMCKALHDGVPALAADLTALFTERLPTLEATGEVAHGMAALSLADTVNGQPLPGSCHARHVSGAAGAARSGLMVRIKDPVAVAKHPVYQLAMTLAQDFYASLQATGFLTAKQAKSAADVAAAGGEGKPEPPATELWCRYLLCQLEECRGNYEVAIEHIDAAIAHTPTAVDLYERRARLLKKSGDLQGASLQMEVARSLDLQDRYINNKSTKYLLRCGSKDQAMETHGMFTKHDGDPMHNLKEMQVLWVATEYGFSALRAQEYGPALKKFLQVEKHFVDFIDDQFDFHSYCIRKMTLRAYVAALQLSETIGHHVAYQRACCGAVQCFLDLQDDPLLANAGNGNTTTELDEAALAGMSASEKKKAKQAMRKAKAKAEAEAAAAKEKAAAEAATAAAAAAEKKGGDGDDDDDNDEDDNGKGKDKKTSKFPAPPPPPPDPDPLGHDHLKKVPLVEAAKLVVGLEKFAPRSISTHMAAFDTASRRRKPLMALQALLRAHNLDATDPSVFLRTSAFLLGAMVVSSSATSSQAIAPEQLKQLSTASANAAVCRANVAEAVASLGAPGEGGCAPALSALQDEAKLLLGSSKDPAVFVRAFAEAHAGASLPHALAAARAVLLLGSAGGGPKEASEIVARNGLNRRGCSILGAEEAATFLAQECGGGAASDAWRALAADKWPRSATFGTVSRPVIGAEEAEPNVD